MVVGHILTVCVLAMAASALPHAIRVPEVREIETSHFDTAQHKVELMLIQGSPDECRATAEDAIKLVNDTVTTSQEFLDELDKGYNCKYEGIAEVNSANETKIQADAAVVEASASMTAAYHATVTLGTQSFVTLTNGGDECGWVMEDGQYQTANLYYENTINVHSAAVTHAAHAAIELQAAIDEAIRLRLLCECRVQHEHNTEWTTANEQNAPNGESWQTAHNMICVLDNITYANCDIGPVPTLVRPDVDSGVETANCGSPEPATDSPTNAPTDSPTDAPTNAPTDSPTDAPTDSPTNAPTDSPTDAPTDSPTLAPTDSPTDSPTNAPTDSPTDAPTEAPSESPTDAPTLAPSESPTDAPDPTDSPTNAPSESPTDSPTNAPSDSPTNAPSDSPTNHPSDAPTDAPTDSPTNAPSDSPTDAPTDAPTTFEPTTLAPTSLAPTTLGPTSLAPTSLAPTSLAPTSLAPTVAATVNCNRQDFQDKTCFDIGETQDAFMSGQDAGSGTTESAQTPTDKLAEMCSVADNPRGIPASQLCSAQCNIDCYTPTDAPTDAPKGE